MKSLIKSSVMGAAFAVMPSSYSTANTFGDGQNGLKNEINVSLFENLNRNNFDVSGNRESINTVKVNPKIIEAAVLSYFDEEVKKFELSQDARNQIITLLDSYFSTHSVLKIGSDGNLIFEIDDKKAFSQMLKQFVGIVLNDMPFIIKKIVIPIFFGGSSSIYEKLDNLDVTLMNMKEKQYKEVIFDYTAGIVKRVEILVRGNMKIGDFYDRVNSYYPNQNSSNINMELNKLGLRDRDIRNLKYPFKK